MPQVFKVGSYWIYFWTNENDPLEPIHVHIAEGKPSENATKVWITSKGNHVGNRSAIMQGNPGDIHYFLWMEVLKWDHLTDLRFWIFQHFCRDRTLH